MREEFADLRHPPDVAVALRELRRELRPLRQALATGTARCASCGQRAEVAQGPAGGIKTWCKSCLALNKNRRLDAEIARQRRVAAQLRARRR